MLERHSGSPTGKAELVALSREPINVAGRDYWSPGYAQWFVSSGPVTLVEVASTGANAILATGSDGSCYRVCRLPDPGPARLAAFKQRGRQRSDNIEPHLAALRARQPKLPWYVKEAMERPLGLTLVAAYHRCLAIQEQRIGAEPPVPGYSSFVRHVRKFENIPPVRVIQSAQSDKTGSLFGGLGGSGQGFVRSIRLR